MSQKLNLRYFREFTVHTKISSHENIFPLFFRAANNNNNNNFIYTPDSEVKLRSVVLTITITYSKTSRVKNVNYTFINYLYYTKSDRVYHLK